MEKKKIVIACAAIFMIAVSIVGLSGIEIDTGGARRAEKDTGLSEDEMVIGEKTVEKGPFYHPNNENSFSVRYWGYKPNFENKYPDAYVPVNNLEKTQTWTVTFQMYNHENRELWFTIEDNGTAGDWTMSQKEMGSVTSGSSDSSWTFEITRENLSNDLSVGEKIETVDLSITSYEDSGYSELYTRDNFDIDFHFIDRKDPGWSLVDEDTFDDNVEEWTYELDGNKSGRNGYGNHNGDVHITNKYYRSPDYALEGEAISESVSIYSEIETNLMVKKTFTTSSDNAYFIADVRSPAYPEYWSNDKNGDDDIKAYLNDNAVTWETVPLDNWVTLCIPLENGTNTVKFELSQAYTDTDGGTDHAEDSGYGWVDDVYVIEG